MAARPWLRLPLPIPVPLRDGAPSERFPKIWTVMTWVEGTPLDHGSITRGDHAAETLAGFLRSLHGEAPADAPTASDFGAHPRECTEGFEHFFQPFVDLPRPQITTSHPDGYLWKRDHVDAWLGDAPAVWIDDDFTGLDHAWAEERTARGTATLLVQPDPHLGLQPDHLNEVTKWVAQLPTVRVA
ncbi:phosphotransferase [Streptomyces sp. NPDC047123]|uniref:phosphotransferase n=1 Tax=Streptomyces sp. NPDC047123 TaxID=3155622 RepID=UPI0033DBC9FD